MVMQRYYWEDNRVRQELETQLYLLQETEQEKVTAGLFVAVYFFTPIIC